MSHIIGYNLVSSSWVLGCMFSSAIRGWAICVAGHHTSPIFFDSFPCTYLMITEVGCVRVLQAGNSLLSPAMLALLELTRSKFGVCDTAHMTVGKAVPCLLTAVL